MYIIRLSYLHFSHGIAVLYIGKHVTSEVYWALILRLVDVLQIYIKKPELYE